MNECISDLVMKVAYENHALWNENIDINLCTHILPVFLC